MRSQTRVSVVGSQPSRPTPTHDRRSWLSHGVAAFAISALGLGVAGSVALTGYAEVTGSPERPPARSAARPAGTAGTTGAVVLPARPGQAATPSARPSAVDSPVEPDGRSERVRQAIVKERAAQRAETLAATAERISRAASSEAAQARQEGLTQAERASREQAAALAWERQQRAIAQRVAAEAARAAAQANTPTSTTPVDVSDIPVGTGGTSPVPGAVIGARFHQYGIWARYHTGLDFRAGFGVPVRAVVAGVVLYAGNTGNWAGNHVAVQHADGYTSMSSHLSSMTVRAGDRVEAGQVIGFVGQTGRAFGAHLHFETYPPGVRYGDIYRAVDPVGWLKKYGVTAR